MRDSKLNLILKATFFSTILLLTAFSALANNSDENSETLQLNYYFQSPTISSIEIEKYVYDRVTLTDGYTAGNQGEPNIQSKGAYILLPPRSKVSNIAVNVEDKISLGFGYDIDPIGESIPISNVQVSSIPVRDEAIYNKNEFYPGDLFTEIGTYNSKGYEILVLLLHPMQYNPVTGELIYFENIKINVETTINGKLNLFRGLDIDKNEVKNKVDNQEVIKLYSNIKQPTFLESYDLLILTTDSLKTGFEPLKNAHNAKGLDTVIKTLTDVGSSDPEDIRDRS
jgi:hypothetical protein